MTEKSYVGMAHHYCPLCLIKHDPLVLLDRRLKETLTNDEFAGFKLCDEHQKLKDDGFIALLCIDEDMSPRPISIATAHRTGSYMHLKADAYKQIIDTDLPENDFNLAFCSEEMVGILQGIVEPETEKE